MKTRRALVLVLALVLACTGVAMAAGVPSVLWFSQRIVLLPGHPLVTQEGAAVPGLVTFFIRDERNRETCVMVLRDMNSGAIYPLGQVDAGSCE